MVSRQELYEQFLREAEASGAYSSIDEARETFLLLAYSGWCRYDDHPHCRQRPECLCPCHDEDPDDNTPLGAASNKFFFALMTSAWRLKITEKLILNS